MFSIFSRLVEFCNSVWLNRSPYWVKITTNYPHCIYYFGDFSSYDEAKKMQPGYIEDLLAEKADGITVEIERCNPKNLTIMEEEFLLE